MGLRFMMYDSFLSNETFSDEQNFPGGFHNSRDFTFIEANILNQCGFILKQLHDGTRIADNDDQQHFIDVMQGLKKPLYHIEYIFLKYLAIRNQKAYLTLNQTIANQ
jgi:uncharacterized protein YifE (UPF0438 family)